MNDTTNGSVTSLRDMRSTINGVGRATVETSTAVEWQIAATNEISRTVTDLASHFKNVLQPTDNLRGMVGRTDEAT